MSRTAMLRKLIAFRALTIFPLLALLPTAHGAWEDVIPSIRNAKSDLRAKQAALAAMDEPMIGNTAPEFGIQHTMLPAPPAEAPFVQVDLAESRRFDTVALIPAVVDFQGATQSPYAFPLRFRLDVSDDPQFAQYKSLFTCVDKDHAQPRVTPLVIHAPGTQARYLRLTVTKLAQAEGRWTFALAELMALDGNRNVALGAKVTHKTGSSLPPRWMPEQLTDGRTPLGPPIDRTSMPEFDGIFATVQPNVPQPWLGVDLGREVALEEVRLHPLHARQGADVPGYAFPAKFRVEAGLKADFSDASPILETEDYPNPGNNPVTMPAKGAVARYVRMIMLDQKGGRFGLSEMEIYSGGQNVARGATPLSSGDTGHKLLPRPNSLLTDGHASYGRILELPEWLRRWEQRRALEAEVTALSQRAQALTEEAQRRMPWLVGSILLAIGAGMTALLWRSHRKNRRAQEQFRAQLARDMHDEIGSSLAGIAVISETAGTQGEGSAEDWQTVNRIALETGDAMREVLWLVGARQESGIDLTEHLQRVAKRLLQKQETRWLELPKGLPASWPAESRRQVFLFFKEALTNITRHARATQVDLSAAARDGFLELIIRDNGRGFDTAQPTTGMGLASLRERARLLGGSVTIDSTPGKGTTITLRAPLAP